MTVTCQEYFSSNYSEPIDLNQHHHPHRSCLMTSTYSITGTHLQERSYTTDKRGNGNSRDAMYQGVRLCAPSLEILNVAEKKNSRPTDLLGQSQIWGVNQQVHRPQRTRLLTYPDTQLTDFRWQEWASPCWVLESSRGCATARFWGMQWTNRASLSGTNREVLTCFLAKCCSLLTKLSVTLHVIAKEEERSISFGQILCSNMHNLL